MLLVLIMKNKNCYGHRFLVLPILLLLVVCFCSCKKSDSALSLNLDDLISSDDSFIWSNAVFGHSIEETENDLGITFPVIPYNSDEWYTDDGIAEEDELFDYRNNNNYYFVEYAAYKDGKPLAINYKGYKGYYTCEFHKGGLRCIYCYFGDGVMPHDNKMDFDGKTQDTEAIYTALIEDATRAFGQPDDSYSLFKHTCYFWDRGGTRFSIAWNTNEVYSDYAMISIVKLDQ